MYLILENAKYINKDKMKTILDAAIEFANKTYISEGRKKLGILDFCEGVEFAQ